MAGSAGRSCYAYRVEHIDSGRYYYGIRTCRSAAGPDCDGYMGSGVAVRAMIAKHGKAAFQKTVLARFDSWDSACRYEAAIVTESALSDPLCLNLKTGGRNGLHSAETRAKISAAKAGCRGPNLGRKFSDEVRRRMSDAHAGVSRRPCPPKTKKRISDALRGRPVAAERRTRIAETLRSRCATDPAVRAQLAKQGRMSAGRVLGPMPTERKLRIAATLRAQATDPVVLARYSEMGRKGARRRWGVA